MELTSSKDRRLNYIKCLVYGDSGIGKTTLLGTLPEERTLIAALERGLLPLGKRDFTVVRLESWQSVREIVSGYQDGAIAHPSLEGKTLDILAIDSLSEISELCKRQIVEVDRRALFTERSKGKSDRPAGVYDDLMGMEDWNLYQTRMRALLSALVKLPCHVVFTCLAAWKEDKTTGKSSRTPNLSGALAQECAAFFDLVLHMESSDQKDENGVPIRRLRTSNDKGIIAKDASGILDIYEDTNLTAIFAKILTRKAT